MHFVTLLSSKRVYIEEKWSKSHQNSSNIEIQGCLRELISALFH